MKKCVSILIILFLCRVCEPSFASQSTNAWLNWTAAPTAVGSGGSVTYDAPAGKIYALRGNSTTELWSLVPGTTGAQGAWVTTLTSSPREFNGDGAHLAYAGSSTLFALQGLNAGGAAQNKFLSYDIPNNIWSPADAPLVPNNGVSLVRYTSDIFYALRGNNTSTFWQYTISTNTWSTMTAAPWNVNTGGAAVYAPTGGNCADASGCIYAFRGATTVSFAKYNVGATTWDDAGVADSPLTIAAGGALAYNGGSYIYALRGNGTASFMRYDLTTNTWSDPAVADAPWAVATGGSLTFVPNGVYCADASGCVFTTRGNSTGTDMEFARYDILANTWNDAAAADTPAAMGAGGSLVYNAGFIYTPRGGGFFDFYRYDIIGNSWSSADSVPQQPNSAGNRCALGTLAASTKVFCLRGNGTNDFFYYDIATNKWSPRDFTAAAGNGVSLTWDTADYLFALRGNATTTFRRYTISTNTWLGMANFPVAVSSGGALVYTGAATQEVFGLRGGGTTTFSSYNVTANAWTGMLASPAAVDAGGALSYTNDSDSVYALAGGTTTTFMRYDISANTWDDVGITDAPAAVASGGALVYTNDDYLFGFGGNSTTNFWRYRWRDSVAPNAVADLAAARSCSAPTTVTLTWTGRGDDGAETGESPQTSASDYEVRYNTVVITDANWASSTLHGTPAHAGGFGASQSYDVTGLSENTTYYFAVKARDEVPNSSALSNVVSMKTPTGAQGTETIAPTEAAAGTGGNTMTLTFTLGAEDFVCGRVYVDVPTGWSAPSLTTTNAGYTTSTAGAAAVLGQQIQVTGINLSASSNFTITYGNTSGGGPGADAQTTVGTATFTTSSHSGPGTPSAIGTSPTVSVVAGTGEGTATLSPPAVIASSAGNNIQIVYTHGTHAMNKGRVYVDVPAGWTAPTTAGCPGPAGCVSVSGGGSPSVTTVGQQIQITNVTLTAPSTLTINYNNATAQAAVTCTQAFTVSASAGNVTPAAIASSPSTNVAAQGQGTASSTPNAIVVSSTGNTLNFTYTAGANNVCSGSVYIDVPASFTDAPSVTSTANGYSTTNNGSLSVAGQQIQVTGINLTAGNSMTITYGDKSGGGAGMSAPSATGNNTFNTSSATGAVTPTAIGSSPVVQVANAGEGTATLSPPEVGAGTSGNTMTLTFTAGATPFSNGRVYVDVPSGWSAPSLTTTDAGYTTSTNGTAAVAGQQIQVTGVNLAASGSFTITYGNTGGGGPGATAQGAPAGGVQFTVYSATGPTTPLPIASSPATNVLATGEGTATLSPLGAVALSTGNTLTFTYTAGSTALSNGRVYADVPAGWSAPSTTGSAAGYTTASCQPTCTVAVAGQQIRVTGINLAASANITIVYGSKASNGPGATAEGTVTCSRTFTLSSSVGNVTPMPIASSPTLNVSATGQGTATVTSPSPAEAGANTSGNTITFQYTAGANQICDGNVYIEAPAGWSAPSTTSGQAGYTTASTGTVSVASQQIQVSGVNLAPAGTMTITYGSGSPGATAGSTLGANTFSTKSATGPVSPGFIGASPSIDILATGKGTAVISPTCVSAGSAGNNMTVIYTPDAAYPLTNGRVYVTIPSGWTAPTTAGCPGPAGCVIASAGSLSINGMEIQVTALTLSSPSTLTITYNNVTAQSGAATSISFTTKDSVGNVTPVAIASSPTVNAASSGDGTNTVSPTTTIVNSTGNTDTFTFTAPSSGMSSGSVYIDVPASWPDAPSTTATVNGYSTTTAGSLAIAGQQIQVTGLNIAASASFTVRYGDKTGGGAGATAPAVTGLTTFTTSSSTGSCVTPSAIASSPTIDVLPEGGSGSAASATGYSSQRKAARNTNGYWMFYNNGTAMVSQFSATGLNWSGSEQNVFTTTIRQGSVWQDGTVIYSVGWPTATVKTAKARRGTISSAAQPSWGTESSTNMSGINNTAGSLCSITKASDGFIWLACEETESAGAYNVSYTRSNAADSVASFQIYSKALAANTTNIKLSPVILSGSATGQTYLLWNRIGNIEGVLVNTDLSKGITETIATGVSGNWDRTLSAVSDASADIHTAYIASDGSLRYRYRLSGAWQAEVTLDAAITCYSPTIQLRGTDVYVLYNKGNDIYSTRGVSPYAGANWGTPAIIKTDAVTTTHYTVSEVSDAGEITFIHTSGTVNPYSVKMEISGQGTASITTPSPAELGDGTSGNTLVFSYTAGQSGMSGGQVYIDFPSGWAVTAPSVSGCGGCFVSQAALQTQITSITMNPSAAMTITYSANVTTQGTAANNVELAFSSAAKAALPLRIQTSPTINIKPVANITLSDKAVSIPNSSSDDVLYLTVSNPSSSVTLEIINFKFQFKDAGGTNLTTAEAVNLFSSLNVYLDNGATANDYDGTDTLVGQVLSAAFNLGANGVQQINGDGTVNVQVGVSSSKTYLLVPALQAAATSAVKNAFKVFVDADTAPTDISIEDLSANPATLSATPAAGITTKTAKAAYWKQTLSAATNSSPAIRTVGGSPKVFVGAGTGLTDGRLYCFDLSTGAACAGAWPYGASIGGISTIPSSLKDPFNNITYTYFGTEDGKLHCVDETGAARFAAVTVGNGSALRSSAALRGYITSWAGCASCPTTCSASCIGVFIAGANAAGDYRMYAYQSDTGTYSPSWPVPPAALSATNILSHPFVNNNEIFVGSENGSVYKIQTSNGGLLSSYNTGSAVRGWGYSSSNKLWIGSANGTLYEFNTANLTTPNWTYASGSSIESSTFNRFTSLYFGNNASTLFNRKTDNTANNWTYAAGGAIKSFPLRLGNTVYFTADDGYLYSIDNVTGALRSNFPASVTTGAGSVPGIVGVSGGRIVVSVTDGTQGVVYCLPDN